MLPSLRLRFVLAFRVLVAEVTLDHLALEGAKRVRPDTIGASGPVEALFAFRRHCRGQNSRGQISLRRDGPLRRYHPANV